MVKLTQHRVAWFEQIVLRMNYIPHSVENSGYAASESTGGLPYLLDHSCSSSGVEENHDRDGNIILLLMMSLKRTVVAVVEVVSKTIMLQRGKMHGKRPSRT